MCHMYNVCDLTRLLGPGLEQIPYAAFDPVILRLEEVWTPQNDRMDLSVDRMHTCGHIAHILK